MYQSTHWQPRRTFAAILLAHKLWPTRPAHPVQVPALSRRMSFVALGVIYQLRCWLVSSLAAAGQPHIFQIEAMDWE